MKNITRCTLHDHKNVTTKTSCAILAVCYASDSSVSFEPTFVDFAFVLDALDLLTILIFAIVVDTFVYFGDTHSEFFK